MTSYYQHHVFVCCNQREDGRASCNDNGAQALRDYAKQRIKALGLNGAGPEEIWYSYLDESDVDEIIESHLQNGQPVERLRIR